MVGQQQHGQAMKRTLVAEAKRDWPILATLLKSCTELQSTPSILPEPPVLGSGSSATQQNAV